MEVGIDGYKNDTRHKISRVRIISFLLQRMKIMCVCYFRNVVFFLLEIPLFHVLNARITFGNIFAGDAEVTGVRQIRGTEEDTRICVVDDACFEIPTGYHIMGTYGLGIITHTSIISRHVNTLL